jgi:hypothetical protein
LHIFTHSCDYAAALHPVCLLCPALPTRRRVPPSPGGASSYLYQLFPPLLLFVSNYIQKTCALNEKFFNRSVTFLSHFYTMPTNCAIFVCVSTNRAFRIVGIGKNMAKGRTSCRKTKSAWS